MDRVILYGAGKRGKTICKILSTLNIEVLAIVDSNSAYWGKRIGEYEIESPEKLRELQGENWCITVADFNAVEKIRKDLLQIYRYGLDKEVSYNKLILDGYKNNQDICQSILRKWGKKDYKREKKIIFACGNGLVLGGVEAWVISLCESLMTKGEKNIYIISNEGIYDIPIILRKQIIYVDIDRQNRFVRESVENLIEVIMEKLPCKIITTNTDEIMLAAYLVKCRFPEMIDIIATVHNSNELVYKNYIDYKECADIYIGVSQDIRKNLIQKGIDAKKIYTMNIPFSCDKVLKRTYSKDNTEPIHIGYAGRIEGMEHSQKRMDLLLKLLFFLDKKGINFKMELAGDGTARKKMEEFVHLNNLEEKVIFDGRLERSEIPSFWKRQDICINLADYEGRSISITEAMGNGAIPIVTATSGVRDDIADTVNGFIIPIGDYCSAANRIEHLYRHRDLLDGMGRLAHETVYPKSLMGEHLKFWDRFLNL